MPLTNEALFRLSASELLTLSPSLSQGEPLDQAVLWRIFTVADAIWRRTPDMGLTAPHALLTKGGHSDFFVTCANVLQRSNLCMIMALELKCLVQNAIQEKVDWVVGSDSSALGISAFLAYCLGAKWAPMHKYQGDDGKEHQRWMGMKPADGETVLNCEELRTSGGTAMAVAAAVQEANPKARLLNYVPLVVDRPPVGASNTLEDGRVVLPLMRYEVQTWDVLNGEVCPLCVAGSPALRPREGDNWAQYFGGAAVERFRAQAKA